MSRGTGTSSYELSPQSMYGRPTMQRQVGTHEEAPSNFNLTSGMLLTVDG
jgi:hypothetical protein